MKLKFKVALMLICFSSCLFSLSANAAEMGEIYDFEVVAQSDTVVSVKYNIRADSTENAKLKKATVRAYVDETEVWSLTLGSSDSYHTSVAVLKDLQPDTEYTMTMQITYADGTKAKMSEPYIINTLPDQSNQVGLNIAYGKSVYADSKITNAYGYELITNGFTGVSYSAYDNWSSANNSNEHWAYVDLDKESYFDKIIVKFYGVSKPNETTYPYAQAFNIEGSNDAQNWQPIISVTDNDKALYECTLDSVKNYRYVKIVLKKAYGKEVRFRISEFEVYSARGIEKVLPKEIGYTMGINQTIDEYIPNALFNDGTNIPEDELEYTITSSDSAVLKVEGKKVTAVGKGKAELLIQLSHNGFTKSLIQTIVVSDVAFEEISLISDAGEKVKNLTGGQSVYALVKAANYSDKERNLFAVLGYYDESGKMVAASATDFVQLEMSGGKTSVKTDSIIIPNNASGGTVSVHLVDSLNSLKAYTASVEYEEVQ